MRIPAETVADVVREASEKMTDPNYSAVMVGGFVQSQGPTARYISAHADELGGAEAVVNAIFHAALLGLCFQRANRRTIREMTFEELDHIASGAADGAASEDELGKKQPALVEYIRANVEEEAMRRILVLVALVMEWVS